MTDDEFKAAMSRSGLPLLPETLAELRRASRIMEAMVGRVTRDKPREAEPALVFTPGPRP